MQREDIRSFEATENVSGANGTTFFIAICPWCQSEMKCFPWSFHSRGKRCPNCRALLLPWLSVRPGVKVAPDENVYHIYYESS